MTLLQRILIPLGFGVVFMLALYFGGFLLFRNGAVWPFWPYASAAFAIYVAFAVHTAICDHESQPPTNA